MVLSAYVLETLDPDANKSRRAAAKAWNEFSKATNAVIPFSLVRQDIREERLKKGEVVTKGFHVFEEEPANAVDGAERPAERNFSLGE